MGATESILPSLEDLYKRYGFQLLTQTSGYVIFEQNIAGHHLAEIVPIEDLPASRIDTLKNDLGRSGFSCRIRKTSDLSEIDRQLFSEFFGLQIARQRIEKQYGNFCHSLEIVTGVPYTYKPVSYTEDAGKTKQSGDLVEGICSVALSSGPRLVIIEASAGFGKTCTAYEIAYRLVKDEHLILPLLAELSRNRTATLFRYVLLDEMERSFPGTRSSLARYQIQKGRLVVILDGFDELLYKPGLQQATFDDAETMLDTIREILKGDACVIITTRKSTLLSGDAFQVWLDDHENEFRVHRFLLDRPDPRVWLNDEKRELLNNSGVPIKHLSSPVLFSFLESLSDSEFKVCCAEPGRIVGEYLDRLLQRECIRQDLKMTVEEQRNIFRSVAGRMMSENFKAERKQFFEQFFWDNYQPLLAAVAARYSRGFQDETNEYSASPPDVSDIVQKLLMHAFFDRRLESRGLLGFQNDFILGTLAGENMIASQEREWVGSEEFVDLAITAFEIRASREREKLWSFLQFMSAFLQPNLLLDLDLSLAREVRRDLEGISFSGLNIDSVSLGSNYSVKGCCFVNCSFNRVDFYPAGLSNLTFIKCRFSSCSIKGKTTLSSFFGFDCTSSPSSFLRELLNEEPASASRGALAAERGDNQYERSVLENFWPPGRPNFGKRRALRTLYMGLDHGEHDRVGEAIRRLSQRGLVAINGDYADLNVERLREIMVLLGRQT